MALARVMETLEQSSEEEKRDWGVIKEKIRQEVLGPFRTDNSRARDLRDDGSYVRRHPAPGEAPRDSQHDLLEKLVRRGLKAVPAL